MNRTAATLLVLIVVVGGVFLWEYRSAPWLMPLLGSGGSQQQLTDKVSYSCDEGKTIIASYFDGQASVSAANEPPTPNGSVALSLSDGRTMTLPQTLSGSGIRYANAGETTIFWSKGNTAFMTEGNPATTTFANCITGGAI